MLKIILYLVIPAFSALTVLVVYDFFRLRKTNKLLTGIGITLAKVFCIASCLKLQRDADQIEKMSELLVGLVHDEQFHEAARVKIMIDELKKSFKSATEELKESFGDIVDVEFIKFM